MTKDKFNTGKLITATDCDDIFGGFKNDKERLKYMKNSAYSKMSIAKSFSIFYGIDIDPAIKSDKLLNNVNVIKIGNVYSGTVKEFTKNSLTFEIPGVKEELVAKDNLWGCVDEVNAYLATHNNKLLFEVREKKNNKYIVSVIQGYYRAWTNKINKAIENKQPISVHIDELVRGGYVCHTEIKELYELTGKKYTHSVFIPGSQIVLNIERDFERWLGQDVLVIPQKFMDFRTIGYGADQLVERSLVSSRKSVLQILGMKNMYEIYTRAKLGERPDVKYVPEVFTGKVTGIINSNKKTGIFIEIEDKYITGLMPVDEANLLNYKPGDTVQVYIQEFECIEGKEPFFIDRKNIIKACNLRPVFARA